ncbi:lactococcin 972 family bacteriocin [Streptococcus oralis]|jgi:bacteriocin, lactococcin 972 family|uniref:lactococcin 972 family bacteriocin n=1 Tax=Streptococcus oralis TaxID=1303 RepID=UPI000979493A|nr:lactococcin 972 family bacteriocin [Streptococcus oralis]AQA08449.1 bacteriocin, lactococcin 972 family protein [Streptococcus oralis]MBN6010802.1 lactococcin 972 family bacteriocin [Streptococcus oralis subsp. oralis]MCY7084444.1 lactococcin 972 family bacteriocin [Streptococcus oralis]RKV97989.1 MAG: lactococcin 972 family bacteriocin [Streptococcus sp.]
MKKLKKVLIISALALTATTATIAYAYRYDVEGGTWEYGYTYGINAYSDYYHSDNNHGSKVINRNNGNSAVDNADPGVWSRAWIWDVWDPATFRYNPTGWY